MTLSRFSRNCLLALALFGVAATAHFVLRQHAAIKPSAASSALYVSCIVLIGLGWVGLRELRALDRDSLVRSLRITAIVLIVPMLLIPAARNTFTMVLAAVAAFASFPLALWYKNERRSDRR